MSAETTGEPAGAAPGTTMEDVGEFLLSMIQAFLRTGYYLPEHPESRKAKEGLHEKFVNLAAHAGELSFILRDDENGRTVYIEGVGDQPRRLEDFMIRSMAETYRPRFVTFLERKELLSLSLGARMEPREFSRFIDLMSEPSLADMRDHGAKVNFASRVRERGISHISFVFNEDFIAAKRKLPWRAELALSRLRKDLYLVPLFRNLPPEQMGEVRREILSDILRPLSRSDLLYAFLMNLDLAATAEFSEKEAEEAVFSSISEELLAETAQIFIRDHTGKEKRYHGTLAEEKFPRILSLISERLSRLSSPAAQGCLEEMFHAGLLSRDDLPEAVRERILVAEQCRSFMEKREDYLKHLQRTEDGREYAGRAGILVRMIPNLFESGHVLEGLMIVDTIYGHVAGDSPRAAAAREALASLQKNGSLEAASARFLDGPKEERVLLGRFFTRLGAWAVPSLLGILRKTDDVWKRKQAAEVLFQTGPAGSAALLEELQGGTLPADTRSTVIRVLGDSRDRRQRAGIAAVVESAAGDSDPEVRREAVRSLSRLDAGGHFDLFRSALGDDHLPVRREAVRALGLTGDARALEMLQGIVADAEKDGGEDAWDLGAAAIEAAGRLAGSADGGPGAAALLEIAHRAYPGGRRIFGSGPRFPLPGLLALAVALGHVAGKEADGILDRLAREKDESLSQRAAEVIRRRSGS